MSEIGRPHPAVERYVSKAVSPNERIEALEAEVERLTRERDDWQEVARNENEQRTAAQRDLAAARAQGDALREDYRLGITAPDLRAAASFLRMFRDHGGTNERRSAVIDILEPKFLWIADRLAALPKVVEDDTAPPDAVVMRYGNKSVTIKNLAPPKEDDRE